MHGNCPTTAADREFYQRNGYIRYQYFFSPQELTPLRLALEDAVDSRRARIRGAVNDGRISQDYERVFDQYVNRWTDYPAAKRIAFDARLAESPRRLTGCRHVRIYHDHAMIKPPGERSKPTNWHQDAPYWAMDPAGALSAWIAVDDVNIANGCLHFVPGSHRHGRRESIKLDVAGDSIVDRMREQGCEVPEPVAVEMAAGGVTFHHGCTFHHAGPNRSAAPRRAFAVIYIPDYTTFTGGKDAAGGGAEMQAGEPWDHPLHPILAGE